MCPLCPYVAQNRAALNTHGCKAHESTALACAYCKAGLWWQGAAWSSHPDSVHPQLDHFPSTTNLNILEIEGEVSLSILKVAIL